MRGGRDVLGGRVWGSCLRTASKLGLGAAVTWGGALAKGCTKLETRSIEERASGHGTGGLLVVFGEW